jgi:hypothetical protein
MSSQINDLLQRSERDGMNSLAQYERDYIAVWELHAEASNGSLDQYFANSSGDHAVEALQALQRIGVIRAADVFRRAIDVFGPAGYSAVAEPADRSCREHFWAAQETAKKTQASGSGPHGGMVTCLS